MRRVWVMLAGLALAAGASADVVYLKNGKSIEGQVVVEGDRVTVKIPYGTVSFPRSKVLRIEKGVSAVGIYEKRRAALPAGDAAARLKLAAWCREERLPNRADGLLREVLAIDPENAEARRLLGYVWHEDRWMKPEEKYRAQGLVEFEKQWHKPESVAEIKRARAAARGAEEQRRKAELELQIRAAELEKLRAERRRLEAERAKIEAERARLETERRRLERTFVRYPHFKMIGGSIYYFPDYPACRKGVIIIRGSSSAKKKTEAEPPEGTAGGPKALPD